MNAAAEHDLLLPLAHLRRWSEAPMPACQIITAAEVPAPYHQLLVHTGDMTSRLEAFHGGDLLLTVLHREVTPSSYEREVVLRLAETALPVEYGAIQIDLSAFPENIRAEILKAELPLGGILNTFGFQYHSRPKAYLRVEADEVVQSIFKMKKPQPLYGRCNELLDHRDRPLAQIVEVLRP